MHSIQEIDLYFRKISPDKGFVYLANEANTPSFGLVLHVRSQIEPLIQEYTTSDLKSYEKRVELGQKIYKLFEGTPLHKHLSRVVQQNQDQKIYTRFIWHYHQNEKMFSNLYLELMHNGQNFIFAGPYLLLSRQSREQTFDSCKALNSPLRILLLHQSKTNQSDSEEVVRALFSLMNQRLIEIEIFNETIDEDAAHYIASFQPNIIWYVSHQNPEKSAELDSFNLARLIKLVPAISALRLFAIEGLEALTDENAFSLTRWEPEFSNLHIPARIILPDLATPNFIQAFFEQIVAQQPIDLALKMAKQMPEVATQQSNASPPILYINSLNSINDFQAATQIITPLRGNENTAVWSYLYNPVLTSMRNLELSKISRAIFEKNKSCVAISGESGIGKSELVDQFIIQQSHRFAFIQRFQKTDYQLPHLMIAKIAELLNLPNNYNENLSHPDLKNNSEKFEALISALNRIPALLVFEDMPSEMLTSENENLFSNFLNALLADIQQNTKILFTSPDKLVLNDNQEKAIEFLQLQPFKFEQTFEFLLHSENDKNQIFLSETTDDKAEFIALPVESLKIIHEKLAAQPMLIKLLRYLADSIPPSELQNLFINSTTAEIRTLFFQKFDQMLSDDVTDLMLTCLSLPKNFQLDLLFSIYKQRSSNYKIIADYLDELISSGLVVQRYLQLKNQEVTAGYQIHPQFSEYLNNHYSVEIKKKRLQIFEMTASYYETRGEQENLLDDWLKAINFYDKANQTNKVATLVQKIISQLIQNAHRAFAGKLIDIWLSNGVALPENLIMTYLNQSIDSPEISEELPELFEKMESFLGKTSESSDKFTFYTNLGQRKKEQNDLPGAIANFEKALQMMSELPEFSAQKLDLSVKLGNCHYQLGQFESAQSYYERANSIEKNPFVLFQLGNIRYMQKDTQATQDYYGEALFLANEQNSSRLVARIQHQLGIFFTDSGNYRDATTHFMESISISQANQELASYADSVHELANVQYLNNDYKNALANYEKSFLISAEQGNIQDTAISLHQIGMTYHSLGDSARAIEKLKESLTIAEEIEDDSGILDTNYQMGSIYLSLGNETGALERFQTCLDLACQKGDKRGESDALHEIGYIYSVQGNFQEAKAKLEASLQISETLKDKKRIAGTLHELAQVLKKTGKEEEAQIFSAQADEILQ